MKLKQWLNQTTTNFCKNSRGEDLTFKEVIGYSIAGFGQNLICGLIGSFLMVFMTDALGFGNTTDIFGNPIDQSNVWAQAATGVAFLMLGCRIFDAFNDPIMGSVVDRTRTKWGKCRPYLKWTPVPIAIMTVLCFLPWYPNNIYGFIALSIIYVVWSVAYTIIDVPYWGLSTAMSADTDFRGRLLTVARLLCTAGAGLMTILIPPIAKAALESGGQPALRNCYFIIAIVVSLLSIPMFLYGFKTTKERYISDKPAPTLKHNLQLLFKNKPLMLVVASGILGCARMIYTGAGGLYFAKYVLADEGMFSLITMLVVPGGLVASVLCPLLQKKFGKKWTYIITHLVGGVVMFIMFFVGYETQAARIFGAIGLVLLGVPQGINNIMCYAMIGDTVDYLEDKTGERAEGICFAMQTFINKMGMAATAFLGVMAFAVAGFAENDITSVTKEGSDRLWMMLILSGAISMIACCIPMFFYKFTEKEQKAAIERIAARKAKLEEEKSNNAVADSVETTVNEENVNEVVDNQTVVADNQTSEEVAFEDNQEAEQKVDNIDTSDIKEEDSEIK